ncbi:WD40 repeat-like protein [Mollisia scopiformis]|uniref:WD40 repeat-like protein n=1 Tax=Mollisia scopiformis TaxID=149040 RepID=A0A194XET6_MOLSC|nr:WD40 repeat-like protein [Mollisia scopiformis]KUJ18272.1 WD40 repeat-like protein [Mollisia scopiformis]
MAKEPLDSDRVNYLIWRYLIESDYRETAVRLQKEWNKEDPQQLPFANHVENHSLVAMLNSGLLYSAQHREATKNHDDGAQVESGFFGPLVPSSHPAPDQDIENARKRPIDLEHPQNQSGPPGKKARLSNGYENGFDATPMDIDEEQNADENAYPSPEQLPSPAVATNGPEQGTQMEKTDDLSQRTNFLELSEDPSTNNTVVLHCEFNPRNPMILAAAGTDALARLWTLSSPKPDTCSDSPEKPVSADFTPLLDSNTPSSITITSLSWSSDGSTIALASEPTDEGTAKIEFYAIDGLLIHSFSAFDSPVVCLRWNPSNTACLAISPQDELRGCLFTVMCLASGERVTFSLPNHVLHDQYLDAAWITDDEFAVCGGTILRTFSYFQGEKKISPLRAFDTRPEDTFSKVIYDSHSHRLATASESGTVDVFTAEGQRQTFNAHQSLITCLSWQPLKAPRQLDGSERLLVSAGDDGAISIWNVLSPDAKPKASITMNSAVVALSFSPDGAFIAGGTNQQVMIWDVTETNLPRAIWTRVREAGWETPQSHDSGTEEDQFSLSWDANGERLAYGVNSRLAVIDFRP